MTNNINILNIKKQNLEKIKFSGILFQGVNTRLKADYSFNSSGNSYDNYYDIEYQVKVNNIYCELFSILLLSLLPFTEFQNECPFIVQMQAAALQQPSCPLSRARPS